jgi:hypothetical protein
MFHPPRKVFRLKEVVNPLGELRNAGVVSSTEVHIEIMSAILNLISLFDKKNELGHPARDPVNVCDLRFMLRLDWATTLIFWRRAEPGS